MKDGKKTVAPFAGVWIEIPGWGVLTGDQKSHPSRVCGLKSSSSPSVYAECHYVAPFAGVWIEIIRYTANKAVFIGVAPFAGVWIEISSGGHNETAGCRTLRGCVD